MERIPDPAGAPLDAVWQEEWEKHLMTAALERVKRRVSPRQFQMFDLHVLQKLPVAQTARTLQASEHSWALGRTGVRRWSLEVAGRVWSARLRRGATKCR